jgi:hypothetical protein
MFRRIKEKMMSKLRKTVGKKRPVVNTSKVKLVEMIINTNGVLQLHQEKFTLPITAAKGE